MSRQEIRVGQFELVDGARQTDSDFIIATEPRTMFAPEARKGRLFILLETDQQNERSKQACQLVANTIRKAFYEDTSYSMTASLRKAALAANTALYKHNFALALNQRAYVGVTCAILKDRDIFLAQVAPAQAYALSNGNLRALPTHPSWHSAHDSATPFLRPNALGTSLYIDPELYRCAFSPNDMLILCTSNIAHLLGPRDVETILGQHDPDTAMEQVYELCAQHQIHDAHALAVKMQQVRFAAHDTSATSATTQRTSTAHLSRFSGDTLAHKAGTALSLLGTWFGMHKEPAEQADAAAPSHVSETKSNADAAQAPAEQPVLLPPFPPKTLPIDTGESLEARQQQVGVAHASTHTHEEQWPPSSFLGEDQHERSSPMRASRTIDLSDTAVWSLQSTRPYRSRFEHRPLVDMSLAEKLLLPFRWTRATLDERLQRRHPRYHHPTTVSTSTSNRAIRSWSFNALEEPQKPKGIPWLRFLVLTLLVALLIVYGLSLSRQDVRDRTVQYLDQAEQRMAAVYAAPDYTSAVTRLEEAGQAMAQLRSTSQITVSNAAFWLRYQDLQHEYERAQSSVYLVNFLDDLTVLSEHPLPGGRFASVAVPSTPTQAITDTNLIDALTYIYALDGSSDSAQLYRIPRDGGEPEPFLSPNDTVRGTTVGPIRAQAWRIDNIIAIDQGNNGFGYYLRESGEWNYIRLGGSEIWTPRGRIDLETYQGNLYVWGAEANEILKFASGRYGDIPTLWINPDGLQGRDIGASIDMAIDGDVYLLQPDGSVLVLNQGAFLREIVPEQITPPITAVTRFFVTGTPEQGWIFLLDTMNERIIQMDKTSGRVIQQMQVRPSSELRLNQLTDLYVDTGGSKSMLYLVNGSQIMRYTLPSAPQPFQPADEDSQPAAPTGAPAEATDATTDTAPESIPTATTAP
jgi:hypothetical protein